MINRIRRSVVKRGVFATMVQGVRALPLSLAPQRTAPDALRFDHERGVDTAGAIDLGDLQIESRNSIYGVQYQPVSTDLFHRAVASLDIRYRDFTFVDLGSGKGKALILALEHGFRRVVGVDFAPALLEAADRNLTAFLAQGSIREASWKLVCADAAEYDLPAGPSVIFMYNPFELPVMSKVAALVLRSFYACPRHLHLVYANPLFPEAFQAFPHCSASEDFRIYSLRSDAS